VTPERWRRINDIFHAALERDGEARAAFLRDATAGDADLRREVESLIGSLSKAGTFLDVPAWGVAPELMFDEADSLVGRQVGAYRVTEEIGRGGMGVVYAADDPRLGRQVAIKALTPEYTRDVTRRERLTREARAAASLSHPAIATIFSLEEIEGDLYIVSELVRGRTLRDELGDGPVPVERLIPTLVDLASALCAAHRQGIIHRDLKPENIVRRTDGQIKILDFGLASFDGSDNRTRTRLTQTGTALGTPGYMAPEQLSGGPVDARTDIFAFGVLTWELATGEHPFGADPAALLARMTDLMEGRPASVSRPLPVAGLDRIARKCMRGEPAERYPNADALLEDLRALPLVPRRDSAAIAGPPDDRLWWWRVHQAAVALVHSTMPIAVWATRKTVGGQLGRVIFFATLILATISVTLRLNLWFSARVDPEGLAEHRARVFPAVVSADSLLVLVLFSAGAFVAAAREEFAALIVVVAVASLASLLVIEPATTRSAGLAPRSKRA
jgi:serine/threonine protein kinase